MTIWYVRNRLDQPKATIANQKPNKSLPLSSNSDADSDTTQAHPVCVKWMMVLRMHVIALKLSHCWRLILYAIIISVISRAPPHVNGSNAGQPSRMLPTAAASTWSSNFFDADRIQCPSFVDNSACPCYKFEDGKYSFRSFSQSIFVLLWPKMFYIYWPYCGCHFFSPLFHFICCVCVRLSKFT